MSGVVEGADLERAAELVAGLCRRFEGFRARPYLCPAGAPERPGLVPRGG
jgi:hypothetical protein